MPEVRVRFAPSPTGSLHVGGARTAMYNALYARRFGGRFVLRIEDTDADRLREGAYDAIVDGLRWLGLRWDEGPDVGGPYGPYRQSERGERHRAYARALAARGYAYPCFCTPEELEEARRRAREEHRPPAYDGRCRRLGADERAALEAAGRPAALRLDVARVWGSDQPVVVQDRVRGEVRFDLSSIDDFVILKSNGTAAYNFAVVCDDIDMRISHVIRADEHLSNTPKQLLVYRALGVEPPQFAHIPMVLAADRSKLSKRHGATGVEEFRRQGYLPQALANYLALLGWSFPDERELFSLDEAAQVFDLDRVGSGATVYDVRKLTWMNGVYLRALPADELVRLAVPFLAEAGLLAEDPPAEYVRAVVLLVRERAHTLREVAEGASYFFLDVASYDPKGVEKHFAPPGAIDRLSAALEAFAASDYSAQGLEKALDEHPAVRSAGTRAPFIHAVRLAVSGRTVGPGLFELVALLGRERTEARLRAAIAAIREGRVAALAGADGEGVTAGAGGGERR